MKTKVMVLFMIFMTLFSGCGESSFDRISGNYDEVGQIRQIYYGTVISARNIKISDDGSSMIIGSILGGTVGSAIGDDDDLLYTVSGAILGGILGSSYGERDGQRLNIKLDDYRGEISVILKDRNYRYGDRIAIYVDRDGEVVRDQRL